MRHKAGVMSNKPVQTLYQLVKLIALALCVALFLLLMSGIWDKFISEETTRSINSGVINATLEHLPEAARIPIYYATIGNTSVIRRA